MLGLRFPRPRRSPLEHIGSALISGSLVLFFHVALAMVPRLFLSLSLLSMLPIAALVMVVTILLGRCLRHLLGLSASAPAFVLFNILFLWGVYITKIRQAIPSLLDAIINAECALLLFGFYRIFSGDPGMVSYSSKPIESDQDDFAALNLPYEKSSSFSRIRHCNSCKTSVKGFDHHCPAFGNCIGQKNHRLFVVLLAGFIIAESSYTICSTKFITISADAQRMERIHTSSLVIGTMLFCILQVLWQLVFLIWHIYCICFNIKTEEWINWKRYPEFQLVIEHQPGSPILETRFTNPYNKGLLGNFLDFLKSKD
ncbi:putative palmitoyltransferase ZDHHC12 isoform X2 [Canna indica]|uniref:S-acyltransferase n=1 Tax=Canna indica TaxID=4628 RepID=A0AAQ3QGC3_9LILI|nr:putative palmitoyltransferase ZDHHC12 isoform X2 [Canna indica]